MAGHGEVPAEWRDAMLEERHVMVKAVIYTIGHCTCELSRHGEANGGRCWTAVSGSYHRGETLGF